MEWVSVGTKREIQNNMKNGNMESDKGLAEKQWSSR